MCKKIIVMGVAILLNLLSIIPVINARYSCIPNEIPFSNDEVIFKKVRYVYSILFDIMKEKKHSNFNFFNLDNHHTSIFNLINGLENNDVEFVLIVFVILFSILLFSSVWTMVIPKFVSVFITSIITLAVALIIFILGIYFFYTKSVEEL